MTIEHQARPIYSGVIAGDAPLRVFIRTDCMCAQWYVPCGVAFLIALEELRVKDLD
jgi:hypothetical protein